MLEEESAGHLLQKLLPQILPSDVTFRCIPHQGKSALQKSIPVKLRAWLNPNTFLVILHDQDSNDCMELKRELQQLCSPCQHDPLIRIVCQELEAWYFGDLDAVQQAFPGFSAAKYKNRSRFRRPDSIVKPGKELEKIIPNFNKSSAAKEVPKHMNIDKNTSTSFKHLVTGLRNFVAARISERGN